ncbi:MAG: hypothetical protein JSV35_06030 [Candidatus Bathyarchaeota archaeon]|nr:MAG: hypothetical protein JSV35_06030 [Candidatus Bathyarchaeota archaeon]
MYGIGDYRKGWALRYMREAQAEVLAARKTPSIAQSLILEAMRKAQAALYYSLGDPSFIEGIVIKEVFEKSQASEDPILNFLVEIEKAIQRFSQSVDFRPEAIEEVDDLVQFASDVVELFTGEKA